GKLALGFAFDEVHKTGTLQSIRTRYREITGGYLLSNATLDVIDPDADLYLFPAKEEGTERAGLFLLDNNTPGVSIGDEVDLTTDASVGRMTLRDCKVRSEKRAAKMAFEAADTAIQIHGGYGVSKEFPFEGFYREARMMRLLYGREGEIDRTIGERFLREGR